jgi:hypothetical protein
MLKLTAGTQKAIIKVSLAVIVLVIMYFVWTRVISPKENFEGEYAPMDMPTESYEASEPEDFSAETYGEDEETYDDGEEETYDDGEEETYGEDDETYGEDEETYEEETYGEDEETYGEDEETYGEEDETYGEDETYEEETYGDDDDSEMYDDMNEGFSVMEPTVDDAFANALFTAPVM